ncbi:Transmembrane protein 49 [Echinococcus granulosus]|uniref:Transmembrane protein 49 n=1 Tax=Echinococcus granulosus TaxID=6210 RepID=W6UH46_ECHGR|nr:Transmembrane protein 49 [Echinococcus granulosus]EUB60920.1 Transmembrane protein 49 [Echinococcus granulosus]
MNNIKQLPSVRCKKQFLVEHAERRSLKLWQTPLKTSYYFLLECFYQFVSLLRSILRYKFATCLSVLTFIVLYSLRSTNGPHREVHKLGFIHVEKRTIWYCWWILLGFLSSCGFGSGLHTFVLYLGPFIAQVTLSAYVCQSLDFPEPPYPDELICPEMSSTRGGVSFFKIVRKTELESVLWGLGTAIGELPPYFMARGSRLSGSMNADEIELSLNNTSSSSEVETDSLLPQIPEKKPSRFQRIEVFLQRLVTRAGFIGILLCASVPNPFFDLAGMTCGHFLIPFSTFFGATCIGKALIKAHIQQFAVIAVSSEDHIDLLVGYIGKLPLVGKRLQQPFMEYLEQQKDRRQQKGAAPREGWVQFAISLIVTAAMIAFIVSIINAMAQSYHRRICKQQASQEKTKSVSKNSPTWTKKNGRALEENWTLNAVLVILPAVAGVRFHYLFVWKRVTTTFFGDLSVSTAEPCDLPRCYVEPRFYARCVGVCMCERVGV